MHIEVELGDSLSTRAVYPETKEVVRTDAPKEIQGLGQTFSPTDLLSVAVGSCVLTMMGLVARQLGIDIRGTRVTLEKTMQTTPVRRIGSLQIEIFCPHVVTESVQKQLITAAKGCPVKNSLSADVTCVLNFHWG